MCSQQPRAASIRLHRKIPKLSGFKTNSCPSACALMWSPLHAFFPLPLLQLPEPNPWQRLRGQPFWKIAAASMVPSGCQSLSKFPAEECEGLPLPRLAPTLLSWKGLGGTLRLQQLKAEPQEVASTPCPRGRLSAPCSVALRAYPWRDKRPFKCFEDVPALALTPHDFKRAFALSKTSTGAYLFWRIVCCMRISAKFSGRYKPAILKLGGDLQSGTRHASKDKWGSLGFALPCTLQNLFVWWSFLDR